MVPKVGEEHPKLVELDLLRALRGVQRPLPQSKLHAWTPLVDARRVVEGGEDDGERVEGDQRRALRLEEVGDAGARLVPRDHAGVVGVGIHPLEELLPLLFNRSIAQLRKLLLHLAG